jgi:two-component system, chemotaxis family, response regulator Rcp1
MAAEDPVIRILLVEDNEMDVRATVRAARQLRIANRIDVVPDGATALAHLRRDPAEGPRPDLVLLDLDLPGRDGKEVLAEIKSDPGLRRTPVVVLTTSDDDADVLSAYDLGASAYVTKPVGLDGWITMATSIESFWFAVVRLPPG